MKIKSIEKLRELVDKSRDEYANGRVSYVCGFSDIADEIEAEIAEKFVALPTDEEDDVLRIGDELKCQGKSILLNSLSWDGRRWYAMETVASSGWYPVHLCRHVKPRTIENVLEEFAHVGIRIAAKGGIAVNDVNYYADKNAIAKYADEIRGLLGVDE